MPDDSTMARLTNSVRDKAGAASGCWAMADMAAAAARPSPSAAPNEPMATVRPAVRMEMVATMASSVMAFLVFDSFVIGHGCCNIYRGQNGKDVCLYHAGDQAEHLHQDRKEEGGNRQQNGGDDGTTHDISVQSDGQRHRPGHFILDVERQQHPTGLQELAYIMRYALVTNAEYRHGKQYRHGQCHGCGQRAHWRKKTRHNGKNVGDGNKQEQRSGEVNDRAHGATADLGHLPFYGQNTDSKGIAPAARRPVGAPVARCQPRTPHQNNHAYPGEHQGCVDAQPANLHENNVTM